MVKFKSTVAHVANLNWAEGIVVPNSIAKALLDATDRQRYVAILNAEHRMHCGLIPLGGNYMVYLSKERRKKWSIEPGDEIDVEIIIDESEYGIPLPDEWRELMEIDPEVAEYFHGLKPGEQRNILHAVNSLKRPESRIKKAVQISDYLRENRGNFDYRELAEYIKAANRR